VIRGVFPVNTPIPTATANGNFDPELDGPTLEPPDEPDPCG
jgi:hypothetical protein